MSADIGESPSDGGTAPSDYLPPADQTKGLPTQGAPKIFALLISFDDYPSTVSSDTIDEMLSGVAATPAITRGKAWQTTMDGHPTVTSI